MTARSIADFIDAMIEGISAQMQLEREQLTRGTHAERREVVALIIDGAPITRERASTRLGYDLGLTHTAAVVWTEDPEPDRTHARGRRPRVLDRGRRDAGADRRRRRLHPVGVGPGHDGARSRRAG